MAKTTKKNLPAKASSKLSSKNNTGYFYRDLDIRRMAGKMSDNESAIFLGAYYSLELINRNNAHIIPHLKAYAKCMDMYEVSLEKAGTDYVIGDQINPLINLADKMLARASVLAKSLGLDNWARDRILEGQKPEEPKKRQTKKERLREGFLGNNQ